MFLFRRRRASDSSSAPLPAPVAVLDLETTGLSPRRGDRVVEVAILLLDANGRVEERFESLVNPRRDPGPVHLHGLRPRDLQDAPEFGDIAGHVAERIEGRAIVAHNARFDVQFLLAEFTRIGAPLPPIRCICTLELARTLVPAPNYRLGTLCAVCGLPVQPSHAAAHDAEATAHLLRHLWSRRPDPAILRTASWEERGAGREWPRLRPMAPPLPRGAARPTRPSPLTAVLDALPAQGQGHGPGTDAYLELLSRALEDRQVTDQEAAALRETAEEWGLARATVEKLHREYLRAALRAALADGRLTEREREDIAELARLLGLPPGIVEEMRRETRGPAARASISLPGHGSLAGLSVCFTGESPFRLRGEPLTRELAEQLARNAGLVVRRSVTKDLDLLVCADPATESSKARLARRYRIRIMAEAEFWRRLGIDVE